MGDDNNTTRIRGPDWIFSALWAASGEKSIPKCAVNIPITFLFRDGFPIKTIQTNSTTNYVERVNLDEIEFLERQRGERGLQGESFRLLRAMRKLLLKYADDNEYNTHSNSNGENTNNFNNNNYDSNNFLPDTKLCRVYYTDGEVEDLTLHGFDNLIRSDTWRFQVLLIQGYVPSINQQDGYYTDKPKIRSKLITEGAEAANQFTRALAKYAEKAYDVAQPVVFGSDSFATGSKIIIKEFQSVFLMDPQSKLIFQGSKYLILSIVGNRKEIELQIENEKKSRELSAARSVAFELKGLLQHGYKRGLTVDQLFNHFDTQNCSFVDLQMLMNGLAKLGIGVTMPVCELLLQIIGGVGTNYINIRDLERFVHETDLEVFERIDQDSTIPNNNNNKKNEINNQKLTSNNEQKSRVRSVQSIKSFREETDLQKQQEQSFFSTNIDNGTINNNTNNTNRKNKRKMNRSQNVNDNIFPSHDTLPMPSNLYRVNPPSSKESTTSLPPWATKRQKRALKELNRTQAEWDKKKKKENFNTNNSSYDDLGIGENFLDGEDDNSSNNNSNSNNNNDNNRINSAESRGLSRTNSSSRGRLSSPNNNNNNNNNVNNVNNNQSGLTPNTTTSSILQSSLKELAIQYSLESDVKTCPDDMLHVDHGVMMTYRILKGSGLKTQELQQYADTHNKKNSSLQVYPLKYRNILESNEKKMREKCTDEEALQNVYGEISTKDLHIDGVENESTGIKRWISFTIIIIPDLFMCLQTLEKYLSPILLRYPLARLILVGLPGLPYTHWPKGWVLNADLHAKSIATLLTHVKTSNNWSPVNDEPVIFLAFGTGTYSLAKFIVNYLPSLTWLSRQQIKTIIQINGTQKLTKNFKRICKELRESLLTTANPIEINELISSLHFWDEYLNQYNREKVMTEFWSSRKGIIDKSQSSFGLSNATIQSSGLGYSGVLEQIRGLLIGPDDLDLQSKYLSTLIPLFIIHSTENVFQEPNSIAQLYTKQNMINYNRNLLPSITIHKQNNTEEEIFNSQFLNDGSISLNWVRAGHEVLQERSSFILAIISKIVQLLGIEPTETLKIIPDPNFKNPYDDEIDIEKLIEEKMKKDNGENNDNNENNNENENDESKNKDRKEKEQQEPENVIVGTINLWKKRKDKNNDDDSDIIIEEYNPNENKDGNNNNNEENEGIENLDIIEGESEIERQQRLKDERKRKEKELRKQLIQDRKKRELENETNEEKLMLKQQQEKLKELKREKKELQKMRREDERSLYAEEYMYEVEQSKKNHERAKLRADELFELRRIEALKAVEDQIAMDKAKKLEERRIKAELITKQIEAEQLTMEGEKNGGYNLELDELVQRNTPELDINPNIYIASTHRLIMDITECKNKLLESIKRQILVEQKTLQYRHQKQNLDYEIRRLRQAIQLIYKDTLMKGMGITNNEKKELEANLAQKEETFREFCMIGRIREDQLAACNRSVQLLKQSLQDRENLLRQRIKNMEKLEKKYALNIRKYKLDLEDNVLSKDMERNKKIFVEERLQHLTIERNRLKNHTAHFVDSDVLVPGLLQRCVTKDLKKHLKREYENEQEKLVEITNKIDNYNKQIEIIAIKQEKIVRDYNKISLALRIFYRVLNKIQKQSVIDVIHDLTNKTTIAEKIEKKRQNDLHNHTILIQNTNSNGNGNGNGGNGSNNSEQLFAQSIRNKGHEIRTKEERKFIGIDMILYPEHYRQISTTELEEMRYDPDYQIDLEITDIQRILKLPEQINLALPFLSTAEEIEGHRLCNKYYRGKGDEYYRRADFMSSEPIPEQNTQTKVDNKDSIFSLTGQNIYLSPEDMRQAEIIHEILIKEIRRDRIRTISAGEEYTLSDEERLWLNIDRILSPYVYGEVNQITSRNIDDDPDHFSTIISDSPLSVNGITITNRNISTPNLSNNNNNNNQLQNSGNSYELNNLYNGDDLRYTTIPKNNHDKPVDGDKYQEMRWSYENGEIIFQTNEYLCPYSRDELLQIRSTPINELNENQLKFRKLMDKFYVHEDESLYGQNRLETLLDVTKELYDFILEQDTIINSAENEVRDWKRLRSRTYSNISSNIDDNDNETDEEGSTKIHRIYGSWETVHPASAGMFSQNNYFQISSYNASRDHPASYAVRQDVNQLNLFDMLNENLFNEDEQQNQGNNNGDDDDGTNETARIEVGVEALLKGPTGRFKKNNSNQLENSQYLIVESTKVLAQQDPKAVIGKIVLITYPTPTTLFEINNQELTSRQSRSHQFEIPEKDNMRILEFTVSILYQGSFGNRGYRLGRLAAALFRLPDTRKTNQINTFNNHKNDNISPLPQSIGFAPYKLQSPNLPDQMGRIILLHKPKSKPIPSGVYQIILGAGSTCKYSIEVTCKYAQNALCVIDPLIDDAKKYQSRLPICLKELDDLQTGLRLAERKLLVVSKMITEAEIETQKCQKNISVITEKLSRDDETMEFTEDERRDLMNEQGIIEIEFAQWASTYASRCREKDDIKGGIAMMHRFQRERQEEKARLKEQLADLRRDLPSCIALLRTYQEAANVAISLNTTVQGRVAANTETTTYSSNSTNTSIRVQTPADIIRRRHQREGWNTLTLEEQQWSMLDMALCPHKYEWLTEKEEEENFRRLELGKKPKKKKKYNLAIEQYRLSKVEIGRILAQPFAMLSRKEMNVRKLLTKYHDDPEVLKRNRNMALFNFDPRRAERTRGKQYAAMSKEEKEWASIDRVLHPEVWAYYHHDEDAKTWLDTKGKGALLTDSKASKIGGGSITDRLKKNHATQIASAKLENSQSSINELSNGNTTGRTSPSSISNQQGNSSQQFVDSLTRILDPSDKASHDMIQNEAKYRRESGNLQDIVNDVHKSLPTQGNKNTGNWSNKFNKDQLLKIWKSTNPQLLQNDEERYVYRLLHKYNGSYGAYVDLALQSQKRRQNGAKLGSHVKWDVHGLIVNPDTDGRARELLEELDRAIANKNFWMDSLVLHTNDQRFPTEVLRLQLEDALDAVLADQIRERERVDRMSAAQKGHDDETSDEESSDSDEDLQNVEELTMNKVQARAARRDRRRLKAKQDTLQQEVLVARRMIIERNKTGEVIDESVLLKELGINGCLACRTPECQWKPSVDEVACEARIKELKAEIERVRSDPDQQVWYSTTALSAQLGGGTAFDRDDLLDELNYEVREIERRIHLNNIDKELHDCFCTRNEYVEIKHLHGYSSVLWTNNARKALSARQERLVAMNVAQEIVDDILDYMLEGWFFGERESNYHLVGFVPSVKKDGFMKAGQEQVQSVGIAVAKAKKRRDDKYKGIVSFESMRGELEEKLMPIELTKEKREEDKRVAKEGTDHYHRLNEVEQTIKFGLFVLTLMYFRAMAFLQREKRSWGGDDDAVNSSDPTGLNRKEMTEERRKMLSEESKLIARQKKMDLILGRAREGEARKRDREARERKEAIQRLQEIVRRQRREKEAINHIQRMYRGHLGRKAAKRWAMKRAEMAAINALLNSAATCLQRVWRGWLGRKEAKETRAEMAYFIALMRAQEAEQDEEEYWETHQWERYKRNARNFVNERFRAEHSYKTLGGKAYGADAFNDDDDDDN